MTEADIYSRLAGLAEGKEYPYVAPFEGGCPSPPWLVFSLYSTISGDVLSGQAESTVAVQIDVYAATVGQARHIRGQALLALKPLRPVRVSQLNGYETTTRLYRATLEVSITQ